MSWPEDGAGGPRIAIIGGDAVGDLKTATVTPSWISYANMQWYRQPGTINPDGSITWGSAQLIADASGATYTLTAADVPDTPGTAIRVFVVADGPSVTSDYSTIKDTA